MAVGIGSVAGLVGGLAGIGGSMIMLPALGLVLGYSSPDRPEQHLYAAAAMIVNVLVALPATWRHSRVGACRVDLITKLLPVMAAAMVAGVLVSTRVDGRVLQKVLAAVIAWDAGINLYRLVRRVDESQLGPERTGWGVMGAAGTTAGLAGGLAGLGGGVLMVPILQLFGKIRLRHAIAASAMTMCVSSFIGAAIKLSTLRAQGFSALDAAKLAGLMAPGAVLGSMLGATLTHKLPINTLRLTVSIILLALALKLLF